MAELLPEKVMLFTVQTADKPLGFHNAVSFRGKVGLIYAGMANLPSLMRTGSMCPLRKIRRSILSAHMC